MKTVFTDISEVAHIWANQTQNEAKNSGHNFYFNGKTIYSYGSHFPIAKHVVNNNGEKAVLFTEGSYSNTTSKHISVVRQATNQNIIYCYSPDSRHEENFNHWLRDAESQASKLQTAKKPEKYLSELSYIKSKVDKYATFFSVEIHEKLQAVLSIGNKNEFTEYAAKKEAFELAAKQKAQKELQKRHKKELNEWLNGKSYRLYVRNGYDYLRVNGDLIETTQAVKIPLEYGKKLWKQIKDNSLTIGSKVLDYTVDAVGKEIKIGCHNFKTDYLIKFGEKAFS